MLSAAAAMIAIRAKKSTGGGGDVTPSNSFDFGLIGSSTGFGQSNSVTIAGINTPISLRVTLVTTTPYGGFSRYVNYVETVIPSFPHTFTVSNGDVVYFEAQLITPGDVIYYNVYNDSDGGALLSSMNGFFRVSEE